MSEQGFKVVTGAFGYLGKYITRILLERGERVKTLTGRPERPNPFGVPVEAAPFHFDDPARLVEELSGADTVFNTYWVRFNRGRTTFAGAVANSQNLIRAAVEAGVKKFVQISITNPDESSRLPYFRGKAAIEKTLTNSGLSYAIVRPTVLFGEEDILLNNIAWLLRRLPFFGVFGNGEYRIQPVFVGDVAELAVKLAFETGNTIVDAVGPETFSFDELVRLIRRRVGSRSVVTHIPPVVALLVAGILNIVLRDVIITRDEITGLMSEKLVSYGPATCPTRFGEWLAEKGSQMGRRYASELERHYRRSGAEGSVDAAKTSIVKCERRCMV